ncbi:MAG: LacI family DNA-binding transcriptional regulator [Anaerolineae bacterium]
MPQRKRPTHRDVARLAGVSPGVVSYVINNGPRPTSPEVRERVLHAIDELGYRPNVLGRNLRYQRTNTIGFIFSDYSPRKVFMSSYSATILTGVVEEVTAREYYLLVYPIGVGQDLTQLEQLVTSGRLDGVVVRLVQDPPDSDELLSIIAEAGLPCVCIERACDPKFGFPSVLYDDVGGGYKATRYLIDQGHRRIAHLRGDLHYPSAQLRAEGYRRALADANFEVDEQLIFGNSWQPKEAVEGVERFLALPDPPTAIFAANDDFAFAAIGVLHQRGLRIPDDVAVIGFDDIFMAQDMTPQLTSVRIPLVEIGHQVVDLVLREAAEHEDKPAETITLPVELIRRGTA